MRLQGPFLELLVGVLSRWVLHDVENQRDDVLVEAGEGVAVPLETVLRPSDGKDCLCL